jgi:beta-glucosidase
MTKLTTTRRSAITGALSLVLLAKTPAVARGLGATRATPAFIDDLIGKMTAEEKAGQLTLMAAALGGAAASALNPVTTTPNVEHQLAEARAGRLTGVFNGRGAEYARRLQDAAMQSRLGIPVIVAADIIHGHRTVFPVPLGEAASFEPDLATRTSRVAAVEASAAGIAWTFAPMVDIARDARWGRGVEGSGEDPYLGSLFAAARVKGFQGDGLAQNDTVASCAKHFAAYGAAESGLDYNAVDISMQRLKQVYFPPFRAALDAGCPTVMASFNEINGVPAHANHWLLTEVLRKSWNFGGVVVSDYTGDMELIAAGYASDPRDAAKKAFLAGVDMSMQSHFYMDHLPDLVASGEVPMARLDEAVRRVLELKAKLGLFDNPYLRIQPGREQARVRTPEHLALSREAGRHAIVLLKNDGDLLPLPKKGKRIALVGPFASGQHDLVGPWNVYGDDKQAVDLETGMRAVMGAGASLTVTRGSGVDEPVPGGIEKAVAAAKAADVVVLAIGESTNMSGEAQSRASVTIPEPQQALAEAVAATGTPVVVLLKNGRALALEGAVRDAPAIVVSWFLGSESGPATADMLFGDVAPSARLPVSFPQLSGQEPYYYAHKPTGRPNPVGKPPEAYKAHFRGILNESLYPFGHGLTYSTIAYGPVDAGSGTLGWDGKLAVSATVANTGSRAAEEVVQLYIHDAVASITRPVRELKGFQKIALEPGERRTVTFTLTRSDLMFVGPEGQWTAEPGLFDVWIAPSAEAGEPARFALTHA